jgi:hypothetical protein
VAARCLDHGRAGPLGHGALRRRRNHPVLGRHQVPAGLGSPGGSVMDPPRASTPHGTCESAMNAACSAGRSPANDAANFSRSRNRKPSFGGRSVAPARRAADRR